MAKRKLYAVVGIWYPKDDRTDKAVIKAGGTAAMADKLVAEGGEDAANEWFAANYIRVEAGEKLPRSIPGHATIKGKKISIEDHYLATGRLSVEDPKKE
tara:strand:+ start:2557 stop:2853 length:297 start_codon:yes stop_codon:yes gene_type:complete